MERSGGARCEGGGAEGDGGLVRSKRLGLAMLMSCLLEPDEEVRAASEEAFGLNRSLANQHS